MSPWSYKGAPVQVPSTADIQPVYRNTGDRQDVVQTVLNRLRPWSGKRGVVETMRFRDQKFNAIVVPLEEGEVPIWGVHAGHKARNPQESPFVSVDWTPKTSCFTIELLGSPNQPRLVRAYPGTYVPPLPWMLSAEQAIGGVGACIEFWRAHAYVELQNSIRANEKRRAPSWFKQ